jgi:hypothetical protein
LRLCDSQQTDIQFIIATGLAFDFLLVHIEYPNGCPA